MNRRLHVMLNWQAHAALSLYSRFRNPFLKNSSKLPSYPAPMPLSLPRLSRSRSAPQTLLHH